MSKFEELCASFTKARNIFKQYEEECKVLAEDIWNNIIDYYDIPLTNMSLHNIDAYGAPDKITGFDELLLALREDSFFEFGIGITLFETPKVYPYPHFTIILPINVSIDRDGKRKIRYGEDGKEFIIDKGKKESYQSFFDEIFRLIKSEYDDGLSNMRLHNTFRSIGFQHNDE